MIDICPGCEKHSKVEHVEEMIVLTVRGHKIDVLDKYFRCCECGETWGDPKSNYDPLEIAYAKADELDKKNDV